jgi:hypothetical protein
VESNLDAFFLATGCAGVKIGTHEVEGSLYLPVFFQGVLLANVTLGIIFLKYN